MSIHGASLDHRRQNQREKEEPVMGLTMQQIIDREEIRDLMMRYARGVDRGDWETVRAVYHPDARDDHGDFAR